MSVFPDRIVLKNTTDSVASASTEIAPAGTDPIDAGEIVIQRGSGEVRILGRTSSNTISQLNGGLKNENKGSVTITDNGFGATSFTLTDASITNSKFANNSITSAKISGTIAIANGGTGQTMAELARNALLPSQTGNNNEVLGTDGTNVLWEPYPLSPGTGSITSNPSISIDLLGDVDTSTIAPVSNQFLRWDSLGGKFKPAESLVLPPPPSRIAQGRTGQITKDADYLYVCVATNSWKRIPYSSWNYSLISPSLLSANASVFSPKVGYVDEFFSSVSLLLHFDGADNSTTITDNSSNNFTASLFGGMVIKTDQSKFGGSSGYFDGDAYITYPTSSAFNLSNENFTIETWSRLPSTGNRTMVSYDQSFGTNNSFVFEWIPSNISFSYSTNGASYTSLNIAFTPSVNVWYHMAIVRNGNTLRFFVNGTQVGADQSFNVTIFSPTNGSLKIGGRTLIGSGSTPSRFYVGWLDDFRITKGIARYWSAFTAPTRAFENA